MAGLGPAFLVKAKIGADKEGKTGNTKDKPLGEGGTQGLV